MKKGTRIKIKVKVKSEKADLPDWGLGKGILAEQEMVLGEAVTEKNKIRFALKLNEVYDDLLKNTVEQVVEVEPPKKKPNRKK